MNMKEKKKFPPAGDLSAIEAKIKGKWEERARDGFLDWTNRQRPVFKNASVLYKCKRLSCMYKRILNHCSYLCMP